MGIMARPPPTVPLEERPEEELTLEEARELLRRLGVSTYEFFFMGTDLISTEQNRHQETRVKPEPGASESTRNKREREEDYDAGVAARSTKRPKARSHVNKESERSSQ